MRESIGARFFDSRIIIMLVHRYVLNEENATEN